MNRHAHTVCQFGKTTHGYKLNQQTYLSNSPPINNMCTSQTITVITITCYPVNPDLCG